MRRPIKIAAGLLAILVVVLVGLGYRSYGNVAASPPDGSLLASVRVITPDSGSESPSGVPIGVEIRASSTVPLLSIELWADDAIVFIQEAPTPAGVAQLPGFFSWLPSSPGAHRLQARATDSNGLVEGSEAVWVMVTPEGSSGEVLPQGGEPDATVPAASSSGAGNPPSAEEIALMPVSAPPAQPSPPGAGEPVVPGEAWSPSLGGFLPWLFGAGDPPATPELVGSVDACNVMLSLHDLSQDEMGFRVYRTEMGGGASTKPLLTLGAGAATGWLSIQDEVAFGSIHTYVAEAFNSGGTSNPSNPVTLNTYDAGCAPPEAPPLVTLTPTALKTPLPVDNAYCYVSNTGQIWSRFPAIGFLPVGEGGAIDLAGKVTDLFTQVDTGGQVNSAAQKFWDCWGWAEGALTQLGSFSPDTDDEQQGTFDTEIIALEGSLPLKIGSPTMHGVPALGGSTLDVASIPVVSLPTTGKIGDFAGIDFEDLIGAIDPTATDPQMLAPRLFYSTKTNDCVNRLPGSVKPDFQIPMCHPGDNVSTLDPADVSDHPHAYLLWDLDDTSNCDHPGECVDPRSESYLPYSVVDSGYRLYELTLDGSALVKTFGFGEELFIVPPKGPCGTLRMFEVRTFVKLDQPITYESHSPNAIVLFDEPCDGSVPVLLEVTFDTLTLTDIDDGDVTTQDVEIYGTFNATPTDGFGGRLWFGSDWDLDASCLSSERGQGIWGASDHVRPWRYCPIEVPGIEAVRGKAIKMRSWPLACTFILPESWIPEEDHSWHPELSQCRKSYLLSNNTLYVGTEQGSDSILVSIDIWDVDSFSNNDPVCVVSAWISKEPGSNWNTMDGASWYLAQGDNGNASCIAWFRFDVIVS